MVLFLVSAICRGSQIECVARVVEGYGVCIPTAPHQCSSSVRIRPRSPKSNCTTTPPPELSLRGCLWDCVASTGLGGGCRSRRGRGDGRGPCGGRADGRGSRRS